MTNLELCDKLLYIVNNTKSLYIMGCFGAPMNEKNKKRYTKNHIYNKQKNRTDKILNVSRETFGWDCVGLIKGVLWDWNNNLNKTYGGAEYKKNGIPDVSANGMIKLCKTSKDFNKIEKGCCVWMEGHIGVYIGNGQVIESSPKWEDGVQITYIENIGYKKGHSRAWTLWGYLPWIKYIKEDKDIEKLPDYSKEAINYFISHSYLKGTQEGLKLNDDMVRTLTILYRTLKGEGVIND